MAPHSMVLTTTGQVTTGAVLSCTVIVALQLAELPQSSVATHVRVTLNSWGHNPEAVISVKVISTSPSHASVAVADPKEIAGPHSTGLTTTGHVMTGDVVSCTTMVALQVAALPQSSVAVQVRVNVYACPQFPAMESVMNVKLTTGSQSSVTTGVPKVGSAPQSIGEITIAHMISGGVLSTTSMVCTQVAVFPQSSVAVQVLVRIIGQKPCSRLSA
jgi:hypothetical protein